MEVECRAAAASDSLNDSHSFVLCDARVSGFPIRYASSGFKAMFHYKEGETPAWTERLAGCSCLADSEAAVAAAACVSGLLAQDVVGALQLLEDIAAETCKRVAGGDGGSGETSSVLLVKARRGGEMFVCEIALHLLRHAQTDWSFLVGLHKDVSAHISVRDLLQGAALGEQSERAHAVRTLLRRLHKRAGRQDLLLEHPKSVAHLHEAFDTAWRGFLSGLGSKGDSSKSRKDGGVKHQSGKHGKKSMRSEVSAVSAATTASHVSVARSSRSSGEKTGSASAEKAASSTTATTAPALSTASAAASSASSSTGLLAAPSAKQARELQWKPGLAEQEAESDGSRSSLSEHLLELLEQAGGSEPTSFSSPPRSARKSSTKRSFPLQQLNPEGEPNPVQKKELCEFPAPFALFDPSQPGMPAVVCSAALARLMDRPAREGLIEGLALSGLTESLDEAEEGRALCEAARQGMYHQGCRVGLGAAKKAVHVQPLLEGEVMSVDTSMRPRDCMVYLRQVELDERMYIVGLWARIPNDVEAASLFGEAAGWQARWEDRKLLAFFCLDEQMDKLAQLLASHFWFSAPMRRQTAVCEDLLAVG